MWRCTPDDELVGLSTALDPRHAKLSGAPLELLLGDPLCILRQVSLIQGVALDDPSLGELLPQVPNLILLLFGTRTCHGSGHHASSSAFIVGLLRLPVLAPPKSLAPKRVLLLLQSLELSLNLTRRRLHAHSQAHDMSTPSLRLLGLSLKSHLAVPKPAGQAHSRDLLGTLHMPEGPVASPDLETCHTNTSRLACRHGLWMLSLICEDTRIAWDSRWRKSCHAARETQRLAPAPTPGAA